MEKMRSSIVELYLFAVSMVQMNWISSTYEVKVPRKVSIELKKQSNI